ncbi:MAG: hypothetical protein H0X63_10065 [Flavobacteriales bacterium]|nr:hypothetical protein [Flavobacteriales bacterium]
MKYLLILINIVFVVNSSFSQTDTISFGLEGGSCYGLFNKELTRNLNSSEYVGNVSIEVTIDSISNIAKFVKFTAGKICLRNLNSRCYGYELRNKELPKEFEVLISVINDELKSFKFNLYTDRKCERMNFSIKYFLK